MKAEIKSVTPDDTSGGIRIECENAADILQWWQAGRTERQIKSFVSRLLKQAGYANHATLWTGIDEQGTVSVLLGPTEEENRRCEYALQAHDVASELFDKWERLLTDAGSDGRSGLTILEAIRERLSAGENANAGAVSQMIAILGGIVERLTLSATEGPIKPFSWCRDDGAIAPGMTPGAWRLVSYLWTCFNRTATFDDLAGEIFDDHAANVTSDLVGTHRKHANSFFKDNRISWFVKTKTSKGQGMVSLIKRSKKTRV